MFFSNLSVISNARSWRYEFNVIISSKAVLLDELLMYIQSAAGIVAFLTGMLNFNLFMSFLRYRTRLYWEGVARAADLSWLSSVELDYISKASSSRTR